jgi:anti-sigma B factor antagonist
MNSVELRTRVCGDHIVVALSAELDICQAAATIAAIAGRGPGREHCVIVDLQALDFIDCAALRALARAQQQARQAGGQVLLAAPAGTLARVLGLTGLGEVLGVHASVASALASAAHWRPSDGSGRERNPGYPGRAPVSGRSASPRSTAGASPHRRV